MLVFFGKAFGSHRTVGHIPAYEEAKEDRDNPIDQKDPLPRLQRAGGDKTEAIRQQTANDLLHAVHHVPVYDPSRLLFSSVPDGGEKHKGWLTRRLEQAQERPYRDKTSKVGASGRAGQNSAPGDDAEAQVLSEGHSL